MQNGLYVLYSPSPRTMATGVESASTVPVDAVKQLGLRGLPRDVLSMTLFRSVLCMSDTTLQVIDIYDCVGPLHRLMSPTALQSVQQMTCALWLCRHLDVSEVLRLSSTSRGVQALLLDDDSWVVPFDALPQPLRAQAEAGDREKPGWRRRAVLRHHVAIQVKSFRF